MLWPSSGSSTRPECSRVIRRLAFLLWRLWAWLNPIPVSRQRDDDRRAAEILRRGF